MPGPQSVNRTQTPTAIQPSSVEAAPTLAPKPLSVGQIRDDASSAIHRIQQSTAIRGSRGMSMPQAVATLAAGDFEQTARRASMRMGMGTGPHGTFVAEALRERAGDVEMDVHDTLSLAEIGAELPHILHGSGLALGVLAAGLYVGVEIHHAAEERRNEFIEAVHALGVR